MVWRTPPDGALSPLDWVMGDPMMGAAITGKNDPDAPEVCETERRIDWVMINLAEVHQSRHDHYLVRWTADGTLNGQEFHTVMSLLGRIKPCSQP